MNLPADASRPSAETAGNAPPRVAVIACRVLDAELDQLLAELADDPAPPVEVVRVVRMDQGLHNVPTELQARLQEAIDLVEADADAAPDAIALVYGLCSGGADGLTTRRARLVLPRAHDCITLLLGDRRRYQDYFEQNPGVYWYSVGSNRSHTPPGPERHAEHYRRYVEQYGEDNAQFLMETEQAWMNDYRQATFVDLGIGVTDQQRDEQVTYTKRCADWLGWSFDQVTGDPTLLRELITGPWDDDRFQVTAPGERVVMSGDDRVVQSRPVEFVAEDDRSTTAAGATGTDDEGAA